VRVLVVDDDPGIRAALHVGLEAAGYGCDLAVDGQEGLWRVREFEYDALLLVVTMPGLDGFEVCRRMRAEGIDVPTLMLTARAAPSDQVHGLDGGADDYLTKPFALPVLLARLRALVRRGRPVVTDHLTAGDLVLDPASGRCSRAGTAVPLTAREAQILEVLMRRQGSWVSQRRILDLVWGPDQDVAKNVLEVHISALRRKVDRPFGKSLLHSRRGLGYRVDGEARP
jgi:DNA-binding response OmpR family regulator